MKPLPPFGFRFTRIQKAVLLFLALILILQLIAFFGFQRQRIEVGFVEDKRPYKKNGIDQSKRTVLRFILLIPILFLPIKPINWI